MLTMSRCSYAAAAALMLAAGDARAAPTITVINPVLPGDNFGVVSALSADGTTVVGYSQPAGDFPPKRATRWRAGSGLQPIMTGAEITDSVAVDVSADGSIVCGAIIASGVSQQVSWSEQAGFVSLLIPVELNQRGTVSGMSDAGTWYVGSVLRGIGESSRWASKWDSQGNFTLLDRVPSLTAHFASEVSDDGAVIAGMAAPLSSAYSRAIRWTDGGAAVGVVLPPAPFPIEHDVQGLSADGSVLVGSATIPDIFGQSVTSAYRWTSAGGRQSLGTGPGGTFTIGQAVSANGQVIAGVYGTTEPFVTPAGIQISAEVRRAFIWTGADGLRPLATVLAEAGADLTGRKFGEVIGVSADGRTLLCEGTLNGQSVFFHIVGVLPVTACGPSDVAGAGQVMGADGQLTADDIIVFVGWFFAADARADVAGAGQTVGADGQFTADDIILFINRFFAGC
jgi:uncharacterized membrane protein